MPTYVYRCPACDTRIEVLEKVPSSSRGYDAMTPRCESCGAKTERVFAWAGWFIPKGAGWARRDHKDASKP